MAPADVHADNEVAMMFFFLKFDFNLGRGSSI